MDKTKLTSPEDLKSKVLDVIETHINPKLLEHDGWIELEEIDDNRVYVRFRGACSACSAIYDTLDSEVKPKLMEHIPELEDVLISDGVSSEMLDYARSLFTARKQKNIGLSAIPTDIMGNLLCVVVRAANIQGMVEDRTVMSKTFSKYPMMKAVNRAENMPEYCEISRRQKKIRQTLGEVY